MLTILALPVGGAYEDEPHLAVPPYNAVLELKITDGGRGESGVTGVIPDDIIVLGVHEPPEVLHG